MLRSLRWLVVGILLYSSLFFLQQTILTASDLGRHITNGRLIVAERTVFSTNRYSYTNPDHFVPNHHWLFGVIAYAIHEVSGFSGLTLLSATLYTASFGLILWYCTRTFGALPTALSAVLVLPLITQRSEVRPEAFSLFFFALLFALHDLWWRKRLKTRWLIIGSLLTAASWVNIHIFFFLQLIVTGAFFVQAVLTKHWVSARSLIFVGLAAIMGMLCNPLGLTGILYPFMIFGEYEYRVSENQSPLFFLQYFTQPYHWYLMVLIVVTTAIALCYGWSQRQKSVAPLLLYGALTASTLILIRFSNFYALLTCVVLAWGITRLLPRLRKMSAQMRSSTLATMSASLFGFGLAVAAITSGLFIPFRPGFGLGLTPEVNQSASFYKSLSITGPLFNNFDIGSYLIYHLYPNTKVFVDNRAEAYPGAYLERYVTAQLDEAEWAKLDAEYQFGAVYFNRLENTNWGQEFLVRIVTDPEWAPVYVDAYTLILVRDIPEHAAIIKQYRLPQELFGNN